MRMKASNILILILLSALYVAAISKQAYACDCPPPTIEIISPENKTYATNDIPLIFTLSEAASWIGYSLDKQTNATILGNTTLKNLPGVMFYPARLRVNLTYFTVGAGYFLTFFIEQQSGASRGSLVYSQN